MARRQQAGERVQALGERFAELGRQGRALRERVDRIGRVYGLPAVPDESPGGLPVRPSELPATKIT
jgi:hypothetical protein